MRRRTPRWRAPLLLIFLVVPWSIWSAAPVVSANTPPTADNQAIGVPFDSPSSSQPVLELAARGTIRGYGDGRFGPGDRTLRAQMSAMIARSMGWDGENWGNTFTDQGLVDPDLCRNVGAIAHYGVVAGFGDGTFHPVDPVLYSQTISFISRAMIAKGYWALQPDVPAL